MKIKKLDSKELESTIISYCLLRGITEDEFFAYLGYAINDLKDNPDASISSIIEIMDKKIKEDNNTKQERQ